MNEGLLHNITGAAFAYAAVGALFSGTRLLASRMFLPFHRQAAGRPWDELPEGVRRLILGLMRVAGLGSAAVGLIALMACSPSSVGLDRLPRLVLGFCVAGYWLGVFCVTYVVHRETGAATPFRASFSVFAASLAACVLLLAV